ncbi:hypothetical protein ABZ957_36290 [Streptomyces sp. NPDC046316]|uniref:hypothetical protein n=1 Tax=Streptomyces sp. NPDC046316 TaxID=3154494 RepID=UPI0034050472
MSEEDEFDALVYAETQDDCQLLSVLDVLLEEMVVGLLLPFADDRLKARQRRSAVGSREIVTTDIRVIEERLQGGGDVAPRPVAAKAPRLREVEPLGLCEPFPEGVEADAGP